MGWSLADAGIAKRVFDNYALDQDRIASSKEDRALALEDRSRRIAREDRQDRVGAMEEERLTGEVADWRRTRSAQEMARKDVSAGIAKRAEYVKAWEAGPGQAPDLLRDPNQPAPGGAAAVYEDLLDDPKYASPESRQQLLALRQKAESEGMGEVYRAWSRGATPLQLAKLYNRYGDDYVTGAEFVKDPRTGEQALVVIKPDGKRQPPVTRRMLGVVLGLEKPSEGVVLPDGAKLVNKATGQDMAENPKDTNHADKWVKFGTSAYNPTTKEWIHDGGAPDKAAEGLVKRLNDQNERNWKRGQMDQFDEAFANRASLASRIGARWLARGITGKDGRRLEPEEIADLAKMAVDKGGSVDTVAEIEAAHTFPNTAAVTTQPGGQAGAQTPGKPLMVQGDAAPTAPPEGAPAGGKWVQRTTAEGTGWVYASPDGKSAWGGPPAQAAADGPEVKPNKPQPAVKPDAEVNIRPDMAKAGKKAAQDAYETERRVREREQAAPIKASELKDTESQWLAEAYENQKRTPEEKRAIEGELRRRGFQPSRMPVDQGGGVGTLWTDGKGGTIRPFFDPDAAAGAPRPRKMKSKSEAPTEPAAPVGVEKAVPDWQAAGYSSQENYDSDMRDGAAAEAEIEAEKQRRAGVDAAADRELTALRAQFEIDGRDAVLDGSVPQNAPLPRRGVGIEKPAAPMGGRTVTRGTSSGNPQRYEGGIDNATGQRVFPPKGNAEKPVVLNKDGSFSTERTITVGLDGKFLVLPTIVNGKQVDPDTAVSLYKQGKNKAVGGPFKTQKEADAYARKRSDQIGIARGKEADKKRKAQAAQDWMPSKPERGYIEAKPPGATLPFYLFADGTFGYTDARINPKVFYEVDPKNPTKVIRQHELKKGLMDNQGNAWSNFARQHGLQANR